MSNLLDIYEYATVSNKLPCPLQSPRDGKVLGNRADADEATSQGVYPKEAPTERLVRATTKVTKASATNGRYPHFARDFSAVRTKLTVSFPCFLNIYFVRRTRFCGARDWSQTIWILAISILHRRCFLTTEFRRSLSEYKNTSIVANYSELSWTVLFFLFDGLLFWSLCRLTDWRYFSVSDR